MKSILRLLWFLWAWLVEAFVASLSPMSRFVLGTWFGPVALGFVSVPVGSGSVATVGGAGTTQKIFQSSLAAGGNYTLNAPGSNRLNAKRFKVRFSGFALGHTAATTLQLQLLGLCPTGANVILAQSTARALGTNINQPFSIDVDLIGDGYQTVLASGGFSGTTIGSGIITGFFQDVIQGTSIFYDAPAVLTNNITTLVNFNQEPPISFFAALLFGTSDALNLATLTEFVLIQD